ncbi:MAG: Gfo/Idh/MocA family oxidoreductase [Ilumatobacteraceae bacterium]
MRRGDHRSAPDVDGVELAAVAARDLERACAAADEWGAPLAFGSYDELMASDDVDAVYIGTPASLHREWTLAAIDAGKHVLCEKPLAANADDARTIADAARSSDVVVMEAFHWRYHPFVDRMRAVLDGGELGRIDRSTPRSTSRTGTSLAPTSAGSWRSAGSDDGSGLLRDPVRAVGGGDDPDVVDATAECPVADIDGSLGAELRWPSGWSAGSTRR